MTVAKQCTDVHSTTLFQYICNEYMTKCDYDGHIEKTRALYRHKAAYLMLLPSIVLILIFNYYNVFQAFYYAFTDWSQATRTMREVQFVGFDNFRRIFTEAISCWA